MTARPAADHGCSVGGVRSAPRRHLAAAGDTPTTRANAIHHVFGGRAQARGGRAATACRCLDGRPPLQAARSAKAGHCERHLRDRRAGLWLHDCGRRYGACSPQPHLLFVGGGLSASSQTAALLVGRSQRGGRHDAARRCKGMGRGKVDCRAARSRERLLLRRSTAVEL